MPRKLKIEDLLFLLFVAVAIVLVLWFLFGSSPTIEQAILAIVLGLAIKNHGDIKEIKGMLTRSQKEKWEV